MIRIMIRCPVTKEVTDTGIRTSGREALNGELYRSGRFLCRYCGDMHSLEYAFADLARDGPLKGPWRPNS
jgi:hypothetical protein